MVGHSKWSKVKHITGPLDGKRGAVFRRLVKEITVAARTGGGDGSGYPRLRPVVGTARDQNMPKENTGRAIKEVTTDQKNRPASHLRFIFSKNHGSLNAAGSVLSTFHQKRAFIVPRSLAHKDLIFELTLAA